MAAPVIDPTGLMPLVRGTELPVLSAPRPYFHPVRSLAGTPLTDAAPADHPHHLGLSIAFSDLNGTNFWGGSTYTTGRGPVVLPNHGRQELETWTEGRDQAVGAVRWRSERGTAVAEERRLVRYAANPARGTWSLSMESAIVPAAGVSALEVSSSAVKGRAGAGYGGIFWRFPDCAEPLVLSAAGAGAEAAHGSHSPWLSISAVIGGAPVTVVLAQDGTVHNAPVRPWFIRTEGYLGAGPAVAWSGKAVADTAHPLVQSLHAVIYDGPLTSPEQALQLLEHHPALRPARNPDRTP